MNTDATPPVAGRRPRRFSEVVENVVILVELLLAVHIGLQLAGLSASPAFGIVHLLVLPFVLPFADLLPTLQIGSAQYDPSSALAIVLVPLAGRLFTLAGDLIRLRRSEALAANSLRLADY